MSRAHSSTFRIFTVLAFAAVVGASVSIASGCALGTGRFTWPEFGMIAVLGNCFLVFGMWGTGRHVAENVAVSIVFLVLAAAWALLVKRTFVALLSTTLSGAALGAVANAFCGRLAKRDRM